MCRKGEVRSGASVKEDKREQLCKIYDGWGFMGEEGEWISERKWKREDCLT